VNELVTLNVDLGELPEEPEELYTLAHVANVACGGHAGDGASIRRAVQMCLAHGTRLGAHPSYPDREGFGRRRMTMTPEALRTEVAEQCARLAAVARSMSARVESVKAHGALYHEVQRDAATADALVLGATDALGTSVAFLGPRAGELASIATRMKVRYWREGFADRATRPDGTLVPRGDPGALVVDPARAAELARELAVRGDVDTICVHGDTPGAAMMARAVRAALDAWNRNARKA